MNQDRVYYSREAELQAIREMRRSMLLLLAGGLATGVAVALLLSPSSGKEIREEISRTVEEKLKEGRETVDPMVKQVEKEVTNLGKSIEERTKQH